MALGLLPSLLKQMSAVGAVHYAPKNTLTGAYDVGYDVSTENNVSVLSGLLMLRYLLTQKNIYLDKLAEINFLIERITEYLRSSFDPVEGYFLQGLAYDENDNFVWRYTFAVDCQTWALSVLGPLLVDQWLGPRASVAIWENTKKLSGYHCNDQTGYCEGVGYTEDADKDVFSGEWTLGAINMLRIFARDYNDPSFLNEAQFMLDNVNTQLLQNENIDGVPVTGILYSNKRYWIPFGWWANNYLSTASTGWNVLVQSNYNPLHLGGAYTANY